MNKFKTGILSLAVMLGLNTPTFGDTQEIQQKAPIKKPNVIILFLDDAGYADVKAFGGKYETKNLDKMAAEGQKWTNFYVSSPISSPSRAGLLTGRLGVRNGMYGTKVGVLMHKNTNGLPKSEVTIAEMLRDNGYQTSLLGKWHLGHFPEHYPTRHGFNYTYGPLYSNDMDWAPEYEKVMGGMVDAYTKKDWDRFNEIIAFRDNAIVHPKEEMWQNRVLTSQPKGDGTYDDSFTIMNQTTFTKDLTAQAKNYIDKNQDTPFFMYMAYTQTHVPLFVSPEFSGKTDSLYGDVMQEIDWSVGEIVDHLKKRGLDQDTLIIFTSDNGPWDVPAFVKAGHAGDTGGLAGGKNRTLEGGSRVPAIFYWPGTIKPQVIDGIGSTLDILPTVANLSHSQLPTATLDGIDISSTLLEGKPSPREIYPYYMEGRFEAFRAGDWKLYLMRYENRGSGAKPVANAGYELYNLVDDKFELNNLVDQHPEIVADILAQAQKYNESIGEYAPPLFDFNAQ
ncbi:sulfatase family protein [Providencia sp. Me31A]|uniref:sulfatase family protein n=1 Tax=Providencia sp. Me31A TaxID=3392637 RepID=UPI003D2CE4FB